ncbi:MAG: hypothetical protein WA174_06515 [Rhodoferax sp.]
MLHHFATNHETVGPCVAYYHAGLGVCMLVCECTTEQQANSEAARLNYEAQARAAMAARTRTHHYGMRRTVRYFEPDEFA